MAHLIFDFDGVIIDSFTFHLAQIKNFFDVELTPDEYRDMHRGNFYDGAKESKLAHVDFEVYAEKVKESQALLPLTPGLQDALKEFSTLYTLHLVTSAWHVQAEAVLLRHGILEYFSSRWYRDQGVSKHEKFQRLLETNNTTARECLFITDTTGDVYEGALVDIPSVGVTFGYHSKSELVESGAAYIADSWEDVRLVVKTHFAST